MRTISVFPSAEDVESLTCPAQRMNSPRAICPSTNSTAPLGYVADAVISESCCNAAGDRLQKRRDSLCGQETQLSITCNPYGERMPILPQAILRPLPRVTK